MAAHTSFLRLSNVVWRLFPIFSRRAARLFCKTEMDQTLHFARVEGSVMKAPDSLQHCLLALLKLTLPIPVRYYTIYTDACNYQVGCILLQEQLEGPAKPVEYSSWSLLKAERHKTAHIGNLLLSHALSYCWDCVSENFNSLWKRTTTCSNWHWKWWMQ